MRPFRAEHIGSLLRPAALLAARREFDGGSLSAQALRDAEDRFIRDAVALQERVGLEVITDGEYRRVMSAMTSRGDVSGKIGKIRHI